MARATSAAKLERTEPSGKSVAGKPGRSKRASRGEAGGVIERHRLLAALNIDPRPRLVVVQAPAGYGKTSLLRQHCERRSALGEHVAWVRMDQQSADAVHFLRLLCDAIEGLGQQAESRSMSTIDRPATLQDLLKVLSDIQQPLVLVVDNFETAAVPDFEAVFVQVVRALPERVQLCVGTRVVPSTLLARLKIRAGTVVISNEELCFRPSETLSFFSEFSNLPPSDVAQIHERTDGWPAALQATRLCLRRGAAFRAEAWAGRGVTHDLMDYLSAEMFENLAPAMGSLLLELAIPEKLSAELVEHITDEPRGAERLADIERAGLFLAQVDMNGNWLRFHNLFRHFLLTRAQQQFSKPDLAKRHRRIADWYQQHGLIEEAISHWLEAGDTGPAAEAMASVVDRLVAQERLGLIESYADRLPAEAILQHDNLVRGAVIAYGFRREYEKANELLALQEKQLSNRQADANVLGMHNFSRLFVLAAQDRVEELAEVAETTGQQLSDHSGFPFAVTLNCRALVHVGKAEYEKGRSLMMQAKPLHDRDESLFGQAHQDAIHSMSLSGPGRIDDALRSLEAALRQTERRAFGSVSAGSITAAYLVSHLYEQNRVEEAQRYIDDYGRLTEQQAIVDGVATMDITAARIASNAGNRGEAEEILERLIYLGYRHKLERLVNYAHAELARQATLAGELDAAKRWLDELPSNYKDAPDEGLMFHAGECEACNISWIRWLIHTGDQSAARSLLAMEIRRAKSRHRNRRLLKLLLLNAMAHAAVAKPKIAGRNLLEALTIGREGGFARSFLDEQAHAIALLKQLSGQQGEGEGLAEDPEIVYLDHLLKLAGESPSLGRRAAVPGEISGLIERLTDRERNLLKFVSAGLSNKELAERLSVSTNTIKWHLRNIFEKLQIKNRVQAIDLARRNGLID